MKWFTCAFFWTLVAWAILNSEVQPMRNLRAFYIALAIVFCALLVVNLIRVRYMGLGWL